MTAFSVSSRSSDNGLVFTGTGNAVDDTAGLNAAIAALNSRGGGTLYLEESEILLNANLTYFTAPVSVIGRGKGPIVRKTSDAAGITMFGWVPPGLPNAPSASHYDVAATEGNDYFTTTAFTPARGDIVLLYSDDTVPDLPPHFSGGVTKLASMHKVQYWDEANNRAYVEAAIPDTYATNAKAAVIPMLDGVVVENLTMATDDPDTTSSLLFYAVSNARVSNVRMLQDGPGQILLKYAMNSSLQGLTIEGTKAWEYVYGIVASICNGVLISDFNFTGTRHAFTTTGWYSLGTTRYGGAYNVRLCNGIVNNPVKYKDTDGTLASRIPLDTHPESNHITFDSITVNTAQNGYYCASTRSRNTNYKNCIFRGRNGIGVLVGAPDTTIQGCTFDEMAIGVYVNNVRLPGYDQRTNTYADRLRVFHNTFRRTLGPAFWSQCGHDQWFSHNTIETSGTYAGGSPSYPKAAIVFQYGDGHQCLNNAIVRDPDDGRASIDIGSLPTSAIKIAGNSLIDFENKSDPGNPTFGIGRFLKGSLVADSATDTFYAYFHGLTEYTGSSGSYGKLDGDSLPGGLDGLTTYYVVNATSHSFQLSTTIGGEPEPFSSSGKNLVFRDTRYGAYGLGVDLTADASSDLFTSSLTGIVKAGMYGYIRGSVLPTGMDTTTRYYVVDLTVDGSDGDTFGLSEEAGGTKVSLTDTGRALCLDLIDPGLDTTYSQNFAML